MLDASVATCFFPTSEDGEVGEILWFEHCRDVGKGCIWLCHLVLVERVRCLTVGVIFTESIQDEVMTCQDKEHREQLVKAFDIFRISFLKEVWIEALTMKRQFQEKHHNLVWQNIGHFSGSKATRTKMGISGRPGMGTRLESQCGVCFVRYAVGPLSDEAPLANMRTSLLIWRPPLRKMQMISENGDVSNKSRWNLGMISSYFIWVIQDFGNDK